MAVTDVDLPAPPRADDGGDGGRDPWWHSAWKLAVMGVALVLLGLAAGYALFTRDDSPGAGSGDVGFLQDMRLHHDNAVAMALIYVEQPAEGQDAALRTIAGEILLGQQIENGVIVQLLRNYHQAEANQSGVTMAWMGTPTPAAKMPGIVDDDALRALQAARGKDADLIFTQLMIGHHQGGLHMADFAASQAHERDVRALASTMAHSQRDEIAELQRIAARLRG